MPASELEKPESKGLPERLVFFSDAVVAIALTLLAIDLPVPNTSTQELFYASIRNHAGDYLAFAFSFIVVASAWRNHKRMTALVSEGDSTVEVLTLIWLFCIVLFPFAAKLITHQHHVSPIVRGYSFGFYALIAMIASTTVVITLRNALRNGQVATNDLQAASSAQGSSLSTAMGFALSIPFFFIIRNAWIVWIVGPIAFSTAIRLFDRRFGRGRVTNETTGGHEDLVP
jgi:uncharacterized membrane protein